jgi:hypothetical protein
MGLSSKLDFCVSNPQVVAAPHFGRKSAGWFEERERRWCVVSDSYLVAMEEPGEVRYAYLMVDVSGELSLLPSSMFGMYFSWIPISESRGPSDTTDKDLNWYFPMISHKLSFLLPRSSCRLQITTRIPGQPPQEPGYRRSSIRPHLLPEETREREEGSQT